MKLPSYTPFLWRNCRLCSTKSLLLVFLVILFYLILFYFFLLPLIFTLLAASISHFLTAAMTFSCFFLPTNSSPLFLITRSSSFSVFHVSVGEKNNVKKDSTLLFFLCKSPSGHAISSQKHLELSEVSYLLIELFCTGMPVVRTFPVVLVKCWKVAHWNAKKLPKNCQKTKKLLSKFSKLPPKFLDIFIETLIKSFIFRSSQ